MILLGMNKRRERWNFRIANQIIEKYGFLKEYRILTGISLTGEPHIGHMREYTMAYSIALALFQKTNSRIKIITILDDDSRIKKDTVTIQEQIWNNTKNYLPYYLKNLNNKFTEILEKIFNFYPKNNNITWHVVSNRKLYTSGKYNTILKFLYDNYEHFNNLLLKQITNEKTRLFYPIVDKKNELIDNFVLTNSYKIFFQNKEIDIFNGNCKISFRLEFLLRRSIFKIHFEGGGQDSFNLSKTYDFWNHENLLELNNFFNPITYLYGIIVFEGKKISKSAIEDKNNIFLLMNFVEKYNYELAIYISGLKPFISTMVLNEEKIFFFQDKLIQALYINNREDVFEHEALNVIWNNIPFTENPINLKFVNRKIEEYFKFERNEIDFKNIYINKVAKGLYQTIQLNDSEKKILKKIISIEQEEAKIDFIKEYGYENLYMILYNKKSGPNIKLILNKIDNIKNEYLI